MPRCWAPVLLVLVAFTSTCARRAAPAIGDAGLTSAPVPGTAAVAPLPSGVIAPPLVSHTPPALQNARIYALNIYDAADRRHWERAARQRGELEEAVRELRAETVGDSSDVVLLTSTVRALHDPIDARRRLDAMREANDATRVVADLVEPYAPLVPADVDRLACDARSLELAAELENRAEIARRVAHERETWSRVRSLVVRRAGAVFAERLDAIVAALEAAPSALRVRAIAADELDELRVLRDAMAREVPAGGAP